MKKINLSKILTLWALAVLFSLAPVYAQRAPIDINLIIDGSQFLGEVKDEVLLWTGERFNQILVEGDTVNIWNAGSAANIIYSGRAAGGRERDALLASIREISPSGLTADFSGALREAVSRAAPSPYSYTILISASPAALTSVLSGPQANLLRFSRVEEFTGWRALVVGPNIDTWIRRAASAFISAQ